MSSIAKALVSIISIFVGTGDVKSSQQGVVVILFDRLLKVITDVLKS